MKIMYVHCGEETNISDLRNYSPYWIWTHDLCDAGAALYQLSQQAKLGAGHYVGSLIFVFFSLIHLEGLFGSNISWLVSSVGKALHRYSRGHGFKSSLIFFRSYFNYKFSSVHSCEDGLYSFWNALWMYIRTQSVRSSIFFCRKRSTI